MGASEREAGGTREAVNAYLSEKIQRLSFFTIVCVVIIHAYNYRDAYLQPTTMIHEGLRAGPMVQFFFCNALTRFANPLYFFISGYLFFASFRRFQWRGYAAKIRKRLVTLAIPYCLWVLGWSAVGALVQRFSGFSFPVLEEKLALLREGGVAAFFTAPLPFQFWYIADLFKLALLSPIIYLLVKKLRALPVLLAAIPWALEVSIPYLPNCDGFLFFTLGAHLAVNGVDFPGKARPIERSAWTVAIPILWVCASAAHTLLAASGNSTGIPPRLLLVSYKIATAAGFLSVFILYDALSPRVREGRLLAALSPCTFIIYAVHEPLQHMTYQFALRFTDAGWAHMALFFALPPLFVFLGAGLCMAMRRLTPRAFALLTGGRGK